MQRFEFNTRAKRARRLFGIATDRVVLGPQVVSLEVTHHCNLRCSFCESHGSLQIAPITARRTYQGGRRTMDLDTIRRLARDLADLGTDMVELSGKGDPIAHKDLAEIIRIIKEAGLGCSLVTNGTLARPDLVPTLISHQLDRLSVSFNSGCPEVYKIANGRDLWGKAVAFLTEVLDRRRERGGTRPWVRMSHVISKENVADMDNMVRFPCEIKVDEVVWYIMSELPETGHLQLDPHDAAWILERIPGWTRLFQEAGVAHDLDKLAGEIGLRVRSGEQQDNPLQRQLPCYEAWMFCVIGPDGEVVPCCYCEEQVLGNIFDDSFAKIWTNARYKDMRRRMLNMPKTGVPICKECFTNCNRAVVNQKIYNRIHPLRKVGEPAPETVAASDAT